MDLLSHHFQITILAVLFIYSPKIIALLIPIAPASAPTTNTDSSSPVTPSAPPAHVPAP